MKLLKFGSSEGNKKKNNRQRKFADYYQRNLNSFGKNQMQTLIEKGINLSW